MVSKRNYSRDSFYKTAPRDPKRAPRKPKRGPREPKTAPREPKTAQESPRQPQENPRKPQDSAKTAPREPKTAPRQPKRAPGSKIELPCKSGASCSSFLPIQCHSQHQSTSVNIPVNIQSTSQSTSTLKLAKIYKFVRQNPILCAVLSFKTYLMKENYVGELQHSLLSK